MPNYLDRFKNRFLNNTGFDDHIGDVGDRILSRDGKGNVQKRGYNRLKHISLFHTLIEMNIWLFWLVCFVGFILINLVFATLYYVIGPQYLRINVDLTSLNQFLECFYFSCQTLTAVGYGYLAPTHNMASIVASFQAFFGLMSFAVITGLLYARFSKPRAYLKFSKQAIIRPFRGGKALMFRMATYKNNDLTDVTCQAIVAINHTQDGITSNRFVPLDIEISNIQELILNWTIVHHINEQSPFYNLSKEDIDEAKVEIIVLVKGYDEYFATYVQERTSYLYTEFEYDVKFVRMFHPNKKHSSTILNIDKLSEVTRL